MKRPVRDPVTGTYRVKGRIYKELFGSREQVLNRTAYKTTGGLTIDDLFYFLTSRIINFISLRFS